MTTQAEFDSAVAATVVDAGKFHDIVHGAVDAPDVETEGGLVPPLAKRIAEIGDVDNVTVNAAIATDEAATRNALGVTSAFPEIYDDFSRYADNTVIVHGETNPLIGPTWRLSADASTPKVIGGYLTSLENDNWYLANPTSVGKMKTFEIVGKFGYLGTGVDLAANIIAISDEPLVDAGEGLNLKSGMFHISFGVAGINYFGYNDVGVAGANFTQMHAMGEVASSSASGWFYGDGDAYHAGIPWGVDCSVKFTWITDAVVQVSCMGVTRTYQYASAAAILNLSANPANNDTITIAGRVYTFKTTLTAAADEIKIGADRTVTLANTYNAINLQNGQSGVTYSSGTATRHATVFVTQSFTGTANLMARHAGPRGNAIAVSKSGANITWTDFFGAAATTLTRGEVEPFARISPEYFFIESGGGQIGQGTWGLKRVGVNSTSMTPALGLNDAGLLAAPNGYVRNPQILVKHGGNFVRLIYQNSGIMSRTGFYAEAPYYQYYENATFGAPTNGPSLELPWSSTPQTPDTNYQTAVFNWTGLADSSQLGKYYGLPDRDSPKNGEWEKYEITGYLAAAGTARTKRIRLRSNTQGYTLFDSGDMTGDGAFVLTIYRANRYAFAAQQNGYNVTGRLERNGLAPLITYTAAQFGNTFMYLEVKTATGGAGDVVITNVHSTYAPPAKL